MNKMNKKIAQKIIKMAHKDQKMRRRAQKTGEWDIDVDKENTKKLKKIIKKIGWPTIKLVGKKASHAAWLLVQHADHGKIFQKKCLLLMEKSYRDNPQSINRANIAYLTDRILVNGEKKQLFGTQFYINKKNQLIPRPIADLKNLDKKRKEYGLDSFKKYLKSARKYKPVKSLKK